MQPSDAGLSSGSTIPRWLMLLGALTAIGPFSIDMYLPALPAIEASLNAEPGHIELTLSSFFIGMAIGQLFYGPISDRFGRKKPLYFGLVIYTLSSIACAFSQSATALILLRFLQALGGCAGIVIARAVVRDRCTVRETAQAFSMLILVMGLAPILAPMAGGWVFEMFGWHAIFISLTVFGIACLIAIHFGLRETHHGISRESSLRPLRILHNYSRLLVDRSFIGYTLCGGLVMAGMFAYIAGSPFVLINQYAIDAKHYSWIFGSNALGLIIASQLNARLLKKITMTALLRWFLWLPVLSGAGLLLLQLGGWMTLPLLLSGLFLFIAGLGFIVPNASAAALAAHGRQAGTASALMGAIQFSLAAISGTLIGLWRNESSLPLVGVMTACGVSAWLAHRVLIKPHMHANA